MLPYPAGAEYYCLSICLDNREVISFILSCGVKMDFVTNGIFANVHKIQSTTRTGLDRSYWR